MDDPSQIDGFHWKRIVIGVLISVLMGLLFETFGLRSWGWRVVKEVLTKGTDVVVSEKSSSQRNDCADAAEHWRATESLGTRQAYQDHVAKFPQCSFAALAKMRIVTIDTANTRTERSTAPTIQRSEGAYSPNIIGDGNVVNGERR